MSGKQHYSQHKEEVIHFKKLKYHFPKKKKTSLWEIFHLLSRHWANTIMKDKQLETPRLQWISKDELVWFILQFDLVISCS